MCQVLWNLDVFYPLEIVIKSVKVAPLKNLVFKFQSLTYTPTSTFRIRNQFFKKIQTMCVLPR